MISVFVVDDHKELREEIIKMLSRQRDVMMLGEASNGLDAVTSISNLNPDIVFLDIKMPDINGIEVIKRLKKNGFGGKIIILTVYDKDEYVRRSVRAGAMGYLLKEKVASDLVKALETVRAGLPFFSGSFSKALIEECVAWISNVKPFNNLMSSSL